MNITVADLDKDITLDQAAMTGILGGWHTHSKSTSYSGIRTRGWSSWMNSGIPFVKKRYRDLYRTKYVRIRQHKRQTQFRLF